MEVGEGGNGDKNPDHFSGWLEGDVARADLWRDTLSELFHIHDDLWKVSGFFLTVNAVIIAAQYTLLTGRLTVRSSALVAVLAAIGILTTYLAVGAQLGLRTYWLEVAVRKTLLEQSLGFHRSKAMGVDFASTPRIDLSELGGPDQAARVGMLARLVRWLWFSRLRPETWDPKEYIEKHLFGGRVTKFLTEAFLVVLLVHSGILLFALVKMGFPDRGDIL